MNFKSASVLGDDDPCPIQSKEWNESQSAPAQDLLQKLSLLWYAEMNYKA